MIHPKQLKSLLIDPVVLMRVPEFIAQKFSVLPVAFANGCLQLILPESVNREGDSTIDKLKSDLKTEFTYDTAESGLLFRYVCMHYEALRSEIENCDVQFRFKCPKQWADLNPTESKWVRHCDECSKDVFLCVNIKELHDRASKNQCVALCDFERDTLESHFWLGIPAPPSS